MSVKAETLGNRERDLALSDRQSEKPSRRDTALAELKALQDRIAHLDFDRALELKKIIAHDTAPHCGDCFSRGWTAAIAAIKGARDP